MAFEGSRIAKPAGAGAHQRDGAAKRALRLRALAPAWSAPGEVRALPADEHAEAAGWRIDVFRLGIALAGLAAFLLVPAALVAAVVFLLFR